MFGTAFRWGLPLLGLAFLLWGSLFLYYPIEISPLDALNAFFPNGDELAKITVVDLRFPRALVAIALGANLAVAGALLQTITRNPLASPTLLSVNSGASLAMVTASAISPALLSGYSIALVASIGGGISWLVVMLISNAWKDSSGDRSRVILAGIAVSLLCTALTKLVLIMSEDHAYTQRGVEVSEVEDGAFARHVVSAAGEEGGGAEIHLQSFLGGSRLNLLKLSVRIRSILGN